MKITKRLTVAINNVSDVNQFAHLPPRFTIATGEGIVEILFSTSALVSEIGHHPVTNFDLLITQTSDTDMRRYVDTFPIVFVERKPKWQQHINQVS